MILDKRLLTVVMPSTMDSAYCTYVNASNVTSFEVPNAPDLPPPYHLKSVSGVSVIPSS